MPLRLLIVVLALPALAAAGPDTFTYQNPISSGLDPHGVRDCQVFREGNKWYMTNTSWPHWSRQEQFGHLNPGVPLYSSDDLTHWTFERIIVHRGGPEKWYHRRFWAPEVHRIGGRYYALFNARNDEVGVVGQHAGYAVADSLLGPYTVVTEEAPLCNGNDLTFFEDDDGRIWAFWNRGREFGIGFAQIDLATGTFLTEPVSAIQPGAVDYELLPDGSRAQTPGYDGRPIDKVSKYHAWDSIGIEGAYVVKRDSTYYLFYSSWTRGYEIGYATAPAITGPWTKAPDNPFYGEQSEAACAKNGLSYTGDPHSPFNQVGHNEVFTGPDGRLWLSCHGIMKNQPDRPMLVIDPIEFLSDGSIARKAPSYTRQVIQLP
jgi:xylan 1,4-beta-xylosidase